MRRGFQLLLLRSAKSFGGSGYDFREVPNGGWIPSFLIETRSYQYVLVSIRLYYTQFILGDVYWSRAVVDILKKLGPGTFKMRSNKYSIMYPTSGQTTSYSGSGNLLSKDPVCPL